MLRRCALGSIVILGCAIVALAANTVDVAEVSFAGLVVDQAGNPVPGATITVSDAASLKTISVYSQEDGRFDFPMLPAADYKLRARLLGLRDSALDAPAGEATRSVKFVMAKAEGEELAFQRPGNELLAMLDWPNDADALNFRMMCTYCHQVGTYGFRSPEEPVDWEVMLTRMDGFQGLYKHTQEVLVDKIVSVYGREAEAKWPTFVAPAAPAGAALDAVVTEWSMGKKNDAMIHDLEIGQDGLIYIVNMVFDAVETLDPATGERQIYSIPGGRDYDSTDPPVKGPHSIEEAVNGDMWITLALSGQMAKFDPKTKEFTVVSGAEGRRPRGGYPHSLRIDQKGTVWYTDAARGVLSLHPETHEVKFYRLPDADQVRGGGARGESQGVTPYGIDIAPDGKVWYSKLNGQRVGRVDPMAADGSPDQVVEWQPPVHGPRRLHVAPNGIVWVPGWASGELASFDPETEEWQVYDLPAGANALPYALNIHPQTGDVWVCGTGTDSMLRFDPKSKQFTEYRMPTRVTYTREIEFHPDGSVWVTNSNYPARHIENGYGSIIRVALR
jgi:streptogramin lyase